MKKWKNVGNCVSQHGEDPIFGWDIEEHYYLPSPRTPHNSEQEYNCRTAKNTQISPDSQAFYSMRTSQNWNDLPKFQTALTFFLEGVGSSYWNMLDLYSFPAIVSFFSFVGQILFLPLTTLYNLGAWKYILITFLAEFSKYGVVPVNRW